MKVAISLADFVEVFLFLLLWLGTCDNAGFSVLVSLWNYMWFRYCVFDCFWLSFCMLVAAIKRRQFFLDFCGQNRIVLVILG